MKKYTIMLIAMFVLAGWAPSLTAQYSFWQPEGESFAIEVSLENTDLKRLPIYRNAVQSLAVTDDHVIVGTSAEEGLTPFVYVASLSQRELISYADLNETVRGQRSIQSDFCMGRDDVLYAGTIANKDTNGNRGSGHLLQINVDTDGSIELRDLGSPVPGEGIFSVTCDHRGTTVFGISYPTGKFFTYDITSGQSRVFEDLVPDESQLRTFRSYVQTPDMYLSRALIEDDQGRIYGSTGLNELFYFNPDDESFTILDDKLPEVWGRTSLGQVQSWVKSPDGVLYGGNFGDGQLFELDTSTNTVKNLGKPVLMHQLRGLAYGRDGKIYGVAGGPPGYGHLFSYDKGREGFNIYGNPQFEMTAPGIEQGIRWRSFNMSRLASSPDGKYIVIGEDESLSQLLIFAVDME
jgi:hypothetical protein